MDPLDLPQTPEEWQELLGALPPQFWWMLAALVFLSCLLLVLHVIFSYMLYLCLEAVPKEDREPDSWQAFLLLIPLVGLVWNFIVYPKLAQSYQRVFARFERLEFGDCGHGIGMGYAICMVLGILPLVGLLPMLVAMVLQLMYLLRVWNLRKEIRALSGSPPGAPAASNYR
ncbi:MAG: hypothetical protein M5U26_16055 [Planctomycetota bacterium]|nr:hypothetical protein [Planctomycetota bacterium]